MDDPGHDRIRFSCSDSSYDCLVFLLPRLVPGGCLIFSCFVSGLVVHCCVLGLSCFVSVLSYFAFSCNCLVV